jgi:hypothetical protein
MVMMISLCVFLPSRSRSTFLSSRRLLGGDEGLEGNGGRERKNKNETSRSERPKHEQGKDK